MCRYHRLTKSGLVGENWNGTISNSYSTGAVSGIDEVGGLVGFNNSSTVSNSYSTGTVSGSSGVGGLVGNNWGTVSNSYSTGAVSGSSYVGGLVGSSGGTVSNSYYDTENSGLTVSDGGTGKTTAEMKSEVFVALLNAGATALSMNAWNYAEGEYPKLTNTLATISSYFASGEGTKANPYIIKTKEELEALSVFVNIAGKTFSEEYFKLGNDIALNDTTGWQDWGTTAPANSWTAIGTNYDNSFRGSFDGAGYVISGVYINTTSDNQGLFRYLGNGGTIKNLGVVASYIKGGYYVGGLVGNNNYGTVSNSYSTGAVSGSGNVGGLVGGNSGTVSNSYYNKETSGQPNSSYGVGKTTAEMKSKEFVALLNFGAGILSMNAWDYVQGEYPKLSNKPAEITSCPTGTEFKNGECVDVGIPIIPQVANGKIQVQTIGNAIVLQNLPTNSKVEVYNIKGNRIYFGNAGNLSTLDIGVQAKGMYVVKATRGSERQVMRVVVSY